MVDPLDGTRELLAGRDEFTVNIALMDAGQPRLGVIAAPALGLLWRGIIGIGAERLTMTPDGGTLIARDPKPIRSRTRPGKGAIAIVSRSHLDPDTEAYLARLQPTEKIQCGSALKFCRLAEGAADVYPRLSPTSEWDVGAGHALLRAHRTRGRAGRDAEVSTAADKLPPHYRALRVLWTVLQVVLLLVLAVVVFQAFPPGDLIGDVTDWAQDL